MTTLDEILADRKKPLTKSEIKADGNVSSTSSPQREETMPIMQKGDNISSITPSVSQEKDIGTIPPIFSRSKLVPKEPVESYTSVVDELHKPKELTPEEEAKKQKRQKRNSTLYAIADGISSLSNLYFASKGATSAKQSSLYGNAQLKYQEMFDRRKADQDKYKDLYVNAFGKDMALKRDREHQKQQQDNLQRAYEQDNKRYQDNIAHRDSLESQRKLERKEALEYDKERELQRQLERKEKLSREEELELKRLIDRKEERESDDKWRKLQMDYKQEKDKKSEEVESSKEDSIGHVPHNKKSRDFSKDLKNI